MATQSRRKCMCNWGDDCEALQQQIQRWCGTTGNNDVALGLVKVSSTEGNHPLRKSALYHFKKKKSDSHDQVTKPLFIARHHWPRGLLLRNGKVADEVVITDDTLAGPRTVALPEILGEEGKVKLFTTKLPKKVASDFGITEACDRFQENKDEFVQAPLAPKADVQRFVESLTSDRSSRASDRTTRTLQLPSVTPSVTKMARPPLSGGTPHFDLHTSPLAAAGVAPAPATATPSAQRLCGGLLHPQVTQFAEGGRGNKGFLIGQFSFDNALGAWRHPHCKRVADPSCGDRCCHCHTAASTMTEQSHPEIYFSDDWEMASLVAPKEELFQMLRRRFKKVGNGISSDELAQRCVKVLRDIYGCTDVIDLAEKVYIRPCPCPQIGEGCLMFSILLKRMSDSVTCAPCDKRQRLVGQFSNDTTATANLKPQVNLRFMTQPALVDIARETKKKLKNVSRELRRVQGLLKKDKESAYIDEEDGELLSIMLKASEYVRVNKNSATESIVKALAERAGSSESGAGVTLSKEDSATFAQAIVEEIVNFGKQQTGKDRQVRFTPRTQRLALSLYMQSPAGYEAFRKSSLQVMPSASTVKRLVTKLTPKEGTFPRIYGWFFDEYVKAAMSSGKTVMGHVMCDEMKLRSDFYWNPSNHRCVGIVVDGDKDRIQLADEIWKLLRDSRDAFDALSAEEGNGSEGNGSEGNGSEGEKSKQSYSISLSVNQFRFRSVEGTTHLGEFFFTNGSLTGDELFRQLSQVILGYEMIGVQIYGFACDGGGNNARLLRLLRNAAKPSGSDPWLEESIVSFVNPYDASRRIAVFHCSTHNLKNGRNALSHSSASDSKTTKDFRLGGVPFGWNTVVDGFWRESRRSTPWTSLRRGSVHPDRFDKMNVSYAKDPFKPETLEELSVYLAEQLDCVSEFLSESDKVQRGSFGGGELALARLDFLKRKAKEKEEAVKKKEEDVGKAKEATAEEKEAVAKEKEDVGKVQSDLLALEYLSSMSTIYLDFFMNPLKRLDLKNIEDHTDRLKAAMKFFSVWQKDQVHNKAELKKKDKSSREYEKWFLSHQTFLHLRIGVVGFLTYARYVLDAGAKYVPYLHSNTSNLEAFFSQVRGMKRDTPLQYPKAVGAIDAKLAPDSLKNNKMYASEDMTEANSPIKSMQTTALRRDKDRLQRFSSLRKDLAQRGDHTPKNGSVEFFNYLTPDQFDANQRAKAKANANEPHNSTTIMVNLVHSEMSQRMNNHFSRELLKNENFCKYFWTGLFTKHDHIFESLTKLSRKDEPKFDEGCRMILTAIKERAVYLGAATSKAERSFMVQVYQLQTDKDFLQKVADVMPFKGTDAQASMSLFVPFLVLSLSAWYREMFFKVLDGYIRPAYCPEKSPVAVGEPKEQSSKSDKLREIQMFFGWAVGVVYGQADAAAEKDEACENQRLFVREMWISHEQAAHDTSYFHDCYPPIMQLKAKRFDVTLVSKNYFGFATKLIDKLQCVFNIDTIKSLGTQSVSEAYDALVEDEELEKEFLDCKNSMHSMVDKSFLDELYSKLITKTFHARAGAESMKFKDENTSRYSANAVDTALRESLKSRGRTRQKNESESS